MTRAISPARGAVEPGGRLVKDHQLRVSRKGHRQPKPSPLTAGKSARKSVLQRFQAEIRQKVGSRTWCRIVATHHFQQLADLEGGRKIQWLAWCNR